MQSSSLTTSQSESWSTLAEQHKQSSESSLQSRPIIDDSSDIRVINMRLKQLSHECFQSAGSLSQVFGLV